MSELIRFLGGIGVVLGATLLTRWGFRGKNVFDEYARSVMVFMVLVVANIIIFMAS